MRRTSFLQQPVPSPLQEPWLDDFDSFIATQDVELFSAVTDRNLVITGGGTFLFDLASQTLSWTDPIQLTNFVTGFYQEIPPGSVVLLPGQFLAAVQVRGVEDITGTISLSTFVGSKLLDRPRGELHVDTVICFRYGDLIIFRNGSVLLPDIPTPIIVSPPIAVRVFVSGTFRKCQFLNDTLVGTPDGDRTDFFVRRNSDCSLYAVYLDGLRQVPGIDFEMLTLRRLRFSPAPALGTVFVLDMYEPAVVFQGAFQEANIWNEQPEGAVNGANTTYTLALPCLAGTLRVYIDGMRMRPGADYTVTSPTTFQFASPPAPGSKLLVDYVVDRAGVSAFEGYFVFNEVPAQNTPTEFQTANNYSAGTTQLYLDGMRMRLGTDYAEGPGPNKITFALAPLPAAKIVIDYMKA